jgi:predicted transcriptional regulator
MKKLVISIKSSSETLADFKNHKPKSVYELAKILSMDVSNLNKLIDFFEVVGAVKIKKTMVDGRAMKTPVVEYDQIEFDLKVA